MKHITKFILASILASASPLFTQAKQWSLQDCISYAIKNNITIQKAQLTKKSAYEDYLKELFVFQLKDQEALLSFLYLKILNFFF